MSIVTKTDDRILFLPLGGSGEIGMNMNLYGHQGKWIIVDCGMSFADDHTPGVDLLFPDPSFIEDEQDNLLALLITHGHEDHIGAIPYLWERLQCPIYATPFTVGLIEDKLAEHGLLDEVPIIIVQPDSPFGVGPFNVTYIPLAHSTAEGHGLSLETSIGTLFHTGDWKLDDGPLIGPACPSGKLKALGDEGVLCMIGDSTNVFVRHASGSETDVKAGLLELVNRAKNRVIITTFASNVARLELVGQIALETGRGICLVGRSMQRIYKVARATGYLQNFPKLVDEDDIDYLPKDKVLVLCTGCQGESRAALGRIAKDEHRNIQLSPDDMVIFSSKMIPGNEISLSYLINNLCLKGVEIITEKDAFTHVSGHPGQAELAEMYGWVRPKYAIPVHGEARHLIKHKQFALSQGVKQAIAPKNGDVIEIKPDGIKIIDNAPTGRIALDGKEQVLNNSASIVERRRIMINGYMGITLILNDQSRLASEPIITARGIPRFEDEGFYDELLDAVEGALEVMDARSRQRDRDVDEKARVAVRRICRSQLGKNPTVDVVIIRQNDIDFK